MLSALLAEQVKNLSFCKALKLFLSISTLHFVPTEENYRLKGTNNPLTLRGSARIDLI